MHRPMPALALALSLAPIGCAPSPAPATSAPLEPAACAPFEPAAVTAVLERQREAWNGGDLDGFLAGYERSDALLFTSGAKIRQGYDETRSKYLERYGDSPETMGHLDFEILDVRGLGDCPEAAIVLGRWRLTETAEAGEGVFSVILERQGRDWKIVHDHTSAG